MSSTILVSGLMASAAAQADSLESVLEKRLAGDRSGVCVAAVYIDGERTEDGAYCADPDNVRELGADSRFEIGSISKVFLGLLVAQLVERGELDLDQPVAELLSTDSPLPEYEGQPIRVIDLLTHTSGLPRLPDNFEIADPDNPYAGYTPEELLADLSAAQLESKPGERYVYSNFGYMALSLALVHHTGKPLAELLEDEIFKPLGMTRTSLSGSTVQGHAGPGRRTSNWDFHPDLGGVGAIRSTPADMTRWLQAHLGHHEGALKDALLRAGQILIEADNEPQGYAWGFIQVGDRRVLAHDGGTGGFSSIAVVDRETDRASLVLMDTTMAMRGSLGDLALHLVDRDHKLQEPLPVAEAVTGIDLEQYVGRFALFDDDGPFMGDFVVEFSIEGEELHIQASSGGQVQPKLPMVAEGETRFTIAELGLTIDFVAEDDGRVERLDFSQGALELRGKRQ
ncbi:serine hydrolase [Wenzhouxiangella sp. AB-CW3]|nr:serine hydrolase [Wenzhouxiangella sp. AB-CW3]